MYIPPHPKNINRSINNHQRYNIHEGAGVKHKKHVLPLWSTQVMNQPAHLHVGSLGINFDMQSYFGMRVTNIIYTQLQILVLINHLKMVFTMLCYWSVYLCLSYCILVFTLICCRVWVILLLSTLHLHLLLKLLPLLFKRYWSVLLGIGTVTVVTDRWLKMLLLLIWLLSL